MTQARKHWFPSTYFVNLTKASLAQQTEEEVSLVQDGVVLKAGVVLVVNTFEFSDVQVAFTFQLLQLQL